MTATIPIEFTQRSIDEMPFEDITVREQLHQLGVNTSEDIEHLGCTGAAGKGLGVEEIAALRLRLAGGGTGLPCYVGIDRFCLAHNTIGGLQEGQMQRHPEHIAAISRELTPEEAGKVELIEAARRKQGKNLNERLSDTGDILAGREMPKGFEAWDGGPTAADDVRRGIEVARRGEISPIPASVPQDWTCWTCPEHTKTNWACRYCVAQAIVEGPLVPTYTIEAIHPETMATDDAVYVVTAEQVAPNLAERDKSGASAMKLYVLAATFTRRLAREG